MPASAAAGVGTAGERLGERRAAIHSAALRGRRAACPPRHAGDLIAARRALASAAPVWPGRAPARPFVEAAIRQSDPHLVERSS